MTDRPPLHEEVEAPGDGAIGLLRETLRKSFPLESGATIPASVVQLMLILAHVEHPHDTREQAKAPPRRRKRRAPWKAAIIGLGVAAAMLRRGRVGRPPRSGMR